MAKAGKAHGKANRRRRLAFAERGRIDSSHEYILSKGGRMKPLKYVKRNLRLQLSVGKEFTGLDAKLISDILYWTGLDRSVDFDICHR
jgi:hypothetical protein